MIFYSILIIVAFVDQLSKYLVRIYVGMHENLSLWGIQLTHIENSGMAGGMLQGYGRFFGIVAVLFIAVVLYYRKTGILQGRWNEISFGFLAGGAAGNGIDRIWFGQVTDFLVRSEHGVLNLADHAIEIGVLLIIGKTIFDAANRVKSRRSTMEKYVNQIPTPMNMGLKSVISMLRDSVARGAKRRPEGTIRVEVLQVIDADTSSDSARVTWFGHSAFLLEMEGKRLLFDPMLGTRPSPVSWAGSKRYSRILPLKPEDFPAIDAIILSHDHYDHLDYPSIRKLKDKAVRFIVPLGVRKRLIKWGVASDKITEHAWSEKISFEGLTLTCMPARHFSGRGLFDRNSTLWCSWVIVGRKTKVYYSGDSGYGPHFKEIGEKYGPFDLTLIECGQYDERWSNIHMMPEETVQAHIDLGGRLLIPVHWGAFTLAFHAWTDPIERVTKAALEHQVNISTPKIGETVEITSKEFPTSPWWR